MITMGIELEELQYIRQLSSFFNLLMRFTGIVLRLICLGLVYIRRRFNRQSCRSGAMPSDVALSRGMKFRAYISQALR
jgi:hypothetical protein